VIGQHQSKLDTPALCIDLDAMESNAKLMSSRLTDHGKRWRPHVKCHKSPVIAKTLIEAGANGMTSAKVSEAEKFLNAGIRDVLIANLVVGETKLTRLLNLYDVGEPIVVCDHFVQAEAISGRFASRGKRCRVLVEVDLGLRRVGIRPGLDARTLCQGISKLPGVELVGVMGYEGHLLTEPDREKKHRQIMNAMSILEESRDQMIADGIPCDIVSAGGTGSYEMTTQHSAVTELQCGGGIFGDPFYSERCHVTGHVPAIELLATVVGRPSLDRAILDIGRKSIHPDIHPPKLVRSVQGRALPDGTFIQFSAEHTTLELGSESQSLIIGDKVVITPGYNDHTTVLHDRFYGLRDGIVESIIPISARGCLQ